MRYVSISHLILMGFAIHEAFPLSHPPIRWPEQSLCWRKGAPSLALASESIHASTSRCSQDWRSIFGWNHWWGFVMDIIISYYILMDIIMNPILIPYSWILYNGFIWILDEWNIKGHTGDMIHMKPIGMIHIAIHLCWAIIPMTQRSALVKIYPDRWCFVG